MNDSVDMKRQLARQSLQSGREDQAETMLRQIPELDPAHSRGCGLLASLEIHRNAPQAVSDWLERALAGHPDHPGVLTQLG